MMDAIAGQAPKLSQAFSPDFQFAHWQPTPTTSYTTDAGGATFGTRLEAAISQTVMPQETAPTAGNGTVGETLQSFGQGLKDHIQQVNQSQTQANHLVEDYAAGKDVSLHQVMIQLNKAELSLQLATQVRNKLVSAYQEVSRMPL